MTEKKRCCICGTVKNCGEYLPKVFANIEAIGSLFAEYKIIIAYDKSQDNSLSFLQAYQMSHPQQMWLYVETDLPTPFRTHNIAKARNNCLDILRENCREYEYFVMIDCDDVCAGKMHLEHLAYYLTDETQEPLWDALSFNKRPYYDTWALSKYPFVFSNMHFKNPEQYGVYIEEILKQTPEKTLVSCLSAFNGFSMYKTSVFIDCCYYDPKPRLDLIPPHLLKKNIEICGQMYMKGKAALVDCEHRSFHFMAIHAKNAKIRIAPEILFE